MSRHLDLGLRCSNVESIDGKGVCEWGEIEQRNRVHKVR